MLLRLARLIWGTDFDPAIRPLLAVGFTETFAGSALFVFLGIWAIKHLGASQVQLSVAFLLGAVAAIASGWIGGHLSDHIGRRPVMLTAMAAFTVAPLLLVAAGHHVIAGLAAMTLTGVCGAMFNAASYALVADLLSPDRREAGYASVRVANNLGVCFGPPVGALLLIATRTRLDIGVFALRSCLGGGDQVRARTGLHAPESPPRGSFGAVRRDYVSPSSLGGACEHDLRRVRLAAADLTRDPTDRAGCLGFLVIINAGLVARPAALTRAVARFSPSLKLAVAMPLMGFRSFSCGSDSIGVVALLVTIFVVGEMLWVPTSQAVVARFAPADIRGAYMGVFGSASQAAWSLTPFAGLQVRHAFGDFTMWVVIAGISLAAAAAGAIAAGERRVASPA